MNAWLDSTASPCESHRFVNIRQQLKCMQKNSPALAQQFSFDSVLHNIWKTQGVQQRGMYKKNCNTLTKEWQIIQSVGNEHGCIITMQRISSQTSHHVIIPAVRMYGKSNLNFNHTSHFHSLNGRFLTNMSQTSLLMQKAHLKMGLDSICEIWLHMILKLFNYW